MADKEPCFWCGKESVMTLTFGGVRRRACNDCGRKWAVEFGKAGGDIGVSVGGELLSYHPSKELIAEVREKAKSGRLMCAYCSHRIAEDLVGFHVYIPRDMKSQHTYVLCPACETRVAAGDKAILERVEEKIESGKYELGEKSSDYELVGEPLREDLKMAGGNKVRGEMKQNIGRYSDALDAQVELFNYWSQEQNRGLYEYALVDNGMDRGQASLLIDWAIDILTVGEPYYVSPVICELLFEAAKSIPRSWRLTEDALLTPSGFLWLKTPFHTPEEDGPIVALGWATIALTSQGRYLLPSAEAPGERAVIIGYFEQLEVVPAVPMNVYLWKFGGDLSEIPTDVKRPQQANQLCCLFATLMTFLQQRILVSFKFYADRGTRRRAEKAMKRPPSDEIQVVMLRSIERRTGEGEHRDVEWACRWPVRSHWRNQPYGPAGQKHYRPKWIAPYIKGPEDKPLRHPERLFAVVR